jgi:hypothetical protein
MLELFVAADLAVRGTRAVAWSALPDAPVVAPRAAGDRLPSRARAGLATRLHRIASAVEPRPRAEQTPVCS